MKSSLLLISLVLVMMSLQEECVPTSIEYEAIHRDFKKLQKEVMSSSTQDGEPMKSFQCKCYMRFSNENRECRIETDKNNPNQPDCKTSDYIASVYNLKSQEDILEKYIKLGIHLKTDFRSIIVGSQKQNIMGLGDVAVRDQKISEFYLPMDVEALKYQNSFKADGQELITFLKRVNAATTYDQNDSPDQVQIQLKQYEKEKNDYKDTLENTQTQSKDIRMFDTRIVSMEAYPFCFKNDEVMLEDQFNIEQCNMCARLCHDNININEISKVLTCNGVVEGDTEQDDQQQVKVDIKNTIMQALNTNTDSQDKTTQEDIDTQKQFNKMIKVQSEQLKVENTKKMEEIQQKVKEGDELTDQERLFQDNYKQQLIKQKENGQIDQVTVDVAMKFYNNKLGVSETNDKIAKKKQKIVLDALKYLFMSQTQCVDDCKGKDCNCIGDSCTCQGPDCYSCEGSNCQKYECDPSTPKNECKCEGVKCKCKGKNCGCTGNMCTCQNRNNCKCTDPNNGCMCTKGIDCEGDIINKDPDADCSRLVDQVKYLKCIKPIINNCIQNIPNWPDCKNWPGKCEKDTLRWPGCKDTNNEEKEEKEDNDDIIVDPEKIKKYRLQDNEVSLEQFEMREFKIEKDQEYWSQEEVQNNKKSDRRLRKMNNVNGGSIDEFRRIQQDIDSIVDSVGDGNRDEYFNQLKSFQNNFNNYFKSQTVYDNRAKYQRMKKLDDQQIKFNTNYLKDVEKVVGQYRLKFIQRKRRMKQITKESFDQQLRQRLRKIRNT